MADGQSSWMEALMRCPDRCKRCLEFGIADDVRDVHRRRDREAGGVDVVVDYGRRRKRSEIVIDLQYGGDRIPNPLFLQPAEDMVRVWRIHRLIGIRSVAKNGLTTGYLPSRAGKPVERGRPCCLCIIEEDLQQAEQDLEMTCTPLDSFIELRGHRD